MSVKEQDDERILIALADLAKQHESEADQWWLAVRDSQQGELPPNSPDVHELRALNEEEMETIVSAFPPAPSLPSRPFFRWPQLNLPLRFVGVSLATSAAALALIIVGNQPTSNNLPFRHTVTVRSGEQRTRSSESLPQKIVYFNGSQLDVVLTPIKAADSPVYATAILVDEHNTAHLFGGKIDEASGAFRFRGTFGKDIQLEPGRWHLVMMVALQDIDDAFDIWHNRSAPVRRYEHTFSYR